MYPILAAGSATSAFPQDFWIWCAVSSLVSAIIGFVGGYQYARTIARRTFTQASQKVAKLFSLAMETLDSAQEVCGMLEGFPHLRLSSEQTQRLDSKRTNLVDTVAGIVNSQMEIQQEEEKASAVEKPESLNIQWVTSPEDHGTGLPNREAFEANLSSLLELSNQYQIKHGLLLVKFDKLDHLKTRFGTHRAENLLKKMASIVCLAARDIDLTCRLQTEIFVVLMPDVNCEAGRVFCEKIRDTIRNHRFRIDEDGAEVLVTGSFGFTTCVPGDSIELALNRANHALSKSQRRGRNQLHVHDGSSLELCAAP